MAKPKGFKANANKTAKRNHKHDNGEAGKQEDVCSSKAATGLEQGSATTGQQDLTATSTAVVGLSNLGNTCFFNSSLQLLLACAPLQQLLLQDDHDITKGPLGYALQQAVLYASGRSPQAKAGSSSSGGSSSSTYNPHSLLAAVCCHAPVFRGKQQHDAHELMRMLLDGLQYQEQRYAKDVSRSGTKARLSNDAGAQHTNGVAAIANGMAKSSCSSSSSDDDSPAQANGAIAVNGHAGPLYDDTSSSSDDEDAVSADDGLAALCKASIARQTAAAASAAPSQDASAAARAQEGSDAASDKSGPQDPQEGSGADDDSSSSSSSTKQQRQGRTLPDSAAGETAAAARSNGPDLALASSTSALPQVQQQQQPGLQSLGASNGASVSRCSACGAPQQQQQSVLQRKSLLPPEPPTSAGNSSVESVFGGVLSSTITCLACGYCSISYEPFLDLSLPLPLSSGPQATVARKGSLLSRLASRTGGKKKAAAADADSSPDKTAAAATADASGDATPASSAAGSKKLKHKERRKLQQQAAKAAKEAKQLARLAKKKQQQGGKEEEGEQQQDEQQQQQQSENGNTGADHHQQFPADSNIQQHVPALYRDDVLSTDPEQLLQQLHKQRQAQQSQQSQPQLPPPQQQQQEEHVSATDVVSLSSTAAAGGAPVLPPLLQVPTRAAGADSDDAASSTSAWTDLGASNASPPTSAVSCFGGAWADLQRVSPSAASSQGQQPLASSSTISSSSAGAGAGSSSGTTAGSSSVGSEGKSSSGSRPRTLHRRFGSLGSLTALTSGAKGGLSSLFTAWPSRQGSRERDVLDSRLDAAAVAAAAAGAPLSPPPAAAAGGGSGGGGGGGGGLLKFLPGRSTPPPPRPSSALGIVSEVDEQGLGNHNNNSSSSSRRLSIPEDQPVVDMAQQQQQQPSSCAGFAAGAADEGVIPVALAAGASADPSSWNSPFVQQASAEAAPAASGPLFVPGTAAPGYAAGTADTIAADDLEAAGARQGGAAGAPVVQMQRSRLQRAFSDDAVVRLGSLHRSSSSGGGGGGTSIAAADADGNLQQPPAQQQQAAAAGAGAASATTQGQQEQHTNAPGSTADTAQAAAATAKAAVPVPDPFAAAAAVGPGEGLAVKHCLASFFLREEVAWECPKEKALWKARRLSGSGAGTAAAAAASCVACGCQRLPSQQQEGQLGEEGGGTAAAAAAMPTGIMVPHPRLQQLQADDYEEDGPMFKQVSFSNREPEVHLVPGSVEQRGTDLALALAGRKPFCRAVSWSGASLLLTAQLGDVVAEGPGAGQRLHLGLKAAGEGGVGNAAAARVLPGGRELQLGQMELPEVQMMGLSGDESSALLQHWAQLVLNCMADLVHFEGGVSGLQAMVAGGLTLLRNHDSATAAAPMRAGYVDASCLEGQWRVRGQLPAGGDGHCENSRSTVAAAAAMGAGHEGAAASATEAQQQQQLTGGYWEYPAAAADNDDNDDADGADSQSWLYPSAAQCPTVSYPSHADAGNSDGSSAAAKAAHGGCNSTQTVSSSSSPDIRGELQTEAADDSMFLMDEEGPQPSGSQRQQQQQQEQDLRQDEIQQAAASDSSSSRSSAADGQQDVPSRPGSSHSNMTGGEDSSEAAGRERGSSLFRKVPLQGADQQQQQGVAGEAGSNTTSSAAAPAPAAAACSQPVDITPAVQQTGTHLSKATEAGAGAAAAAGVASPGTPGSLRRSSLRRQSTSCSRTAHKAYRIHIAPEVLMLHLKRFQHDGRGRLNKLDTPVKFDFELDLSPFIVQQAAAGTDVSNSYASNTTSSGSNSFVGGRSEAGWSSAATQLQQQQQQEQQQELMYDLVGLVVHMGTMRGGHYIAYVKRVHAGAMAGQQSAASKTFDSSGAGPQSQWYYVSDTSVRRVSQSEVAGAQAYMLMYVRKPSDKQPQH